MSTKFYREFSFFNVLGNGVQDEMNIKSSLYSILITIVSIIVLPSTLLASGSGDDSFLGIGFLMGIAAWIYFLFRGSRKKKSQDNSDK